MTIFLIRNFAICLLLFLFSCSQEEESKSYYNNGQLKETGKLEAKKRKGWWFKFDSNGDTLEANFYKSDILTAKKIYINNKFSILDSLRGNERIRFTYYKEGSLKSKKKFIEGKKEGKSLLYFPNGKIKVESSFQDDQPSGLFKQYYPSGKLQFYTENIGNGILKVYDSSGTLSYEILYKNMSIADTVKVY